MTLTQISTAAVKDDAVTAGKIPANAVGSSELADNAVDTAAIADSAVTTAKIANDAIDGNKIADDAVGGAAILNNSISTSKIQDNAVTLAKLPHGDGSSNGKFLRANNGADPSFETITGTTINNNAADRIITGEGGTTLNGESGLTYTGSRLTQSSGDTIIDQTNNGYGGLRIVDSSAGNYSVSYILGRNSGASAHVFKYSGRTQNQSPWANNGTGVEMGRWSGYGISFNGDTAAANALDDYEEGTWSPGGSWTTITAQYTKIGRMVYAGFSLRANASSGNANISNLPFTAGSTHGHCGGIVWGLIEWDSNNGGQLNGFPNDGTTTVGIRRNLATQLEFGSANNKLNQNAFIRGMVVYQTN